MYNFSVDYDAINKSDVLNIHKYLMTKNIKQVFIITKQVFIILLSYSSSLTRVAKVRTKCLSLNDETCMVWPTLIDLNPAELKNYPFMISLDKCIGSCNVLSPKICIPKKTKDINGKAFNMIANKNEAKTMTEHISCDCKCKFNSTIRNRIMKHVNVSVKIIVHEKKIRVGILAHVFVRKASI